MNDLNRQAAELVLEWEYIDDLHWRKDGEWMKDGTPFDPLHSISDAFLLVEKISEMSKEIQDKFENALIKNQGNVLTCDVFKLTPEAITKAAIKAVQANGG